MSAIARRLYHDRADWPAPYWRNRGRIHWADDIYAGQVPRVPPKPARTPSAPAALEPPVPTGLAPSGASSAVPAQALGSSAAVTSQSASGTRSGAFGACVIAHESGGNAQIMNSTDHYGLYQFSESTWAPYDGC